MGEALELLLQDGVIEAVLGRLKTGKEAEVWLVQHAGQVAAAKVYKERHERNFRNNAGYREGRDVRNSRTRRAMEKGTRFGQAAADEAWKAAEADTLEVLHAKGVRVPAPLSFYEGVLVMELVLDAEGAPAPRLVEAPPRSADEARAVYLDLRQQIVRMLCVDLIHGDLSAYNVLVAAGGPTIIDFPQTLVAARNSQAEGYFRRDLENIRTFLAGVDPRIDASAGDAQSIWSAYVRRELTLDFVPRGGERGGARPASFEPRRAVVAPPVAPQGPVDPEQELRELEARFLRQGGGERGKPPAAPPPRGGRRGGRGARGGPPRQGGGATRPGGAKAGAPDRAGGGPQRGKPAQGGGQPGPATGGGGRGQQRGGPEVGGRAAGAAEGGGQQQGGQGARGGGPRQGGGAPGAMRGGAGRQHGGPGARGGDSRQGGGGPAGMPGGDGRQRSGRGARGGGGPPGGGRGAAGTDGRGGGAGSPRAADNPGSQQGGDRDRRGDGRNRGGGARPVPAVTYVSRPSRPSPDAPGPHPIPGKGSDQDS